MIKKNKIHLSMTLRQSRKKEFSTINIISFCDPERKGKSVFTSSLFTRSSKFHEPCRDPLKSTLPDPLSFTGVRTLGVLGERESEDGERGSGHSNETGSFLLSRSTILI